MKYTQVATDAFQKLQLNAGVLLSEFTPSTPTLDKTKILGATGGGVSFEAVPQFVDNGDGIDNIPANTMELKKIDRYDVKLSGTFKTVDTALAKKLVSVATVTAASGKVAPSQNLTESDFDDIWWVGDYSDVNVDSGSGQTAKNAGFLAIKLINALSTGGFKIKSNDKGKGDFAFEFTAHYSLDDIDAVPFEIYVKQGETAA